MQLTFLFFGVFLMNLPATADTTKESVLYFCDYANGIFSYGLESKKLKLLYKSEVNSYVMSVTKTADGDIAFSECPMLGECKLKLLDKNNLSVKTIGAGSFININKKTLLHTKVEEKHNGHALSLTQTKFFFNFANSTLIYGPVDPSRVVNASRGVFYRSKLNTMNVTSSLFYYDYTNHENIYIGDNLVPLFYSQNDAGLVVYSLSEDNYKLVKVEGSPQIPSILPHTDLDIFDPIIVKDAHNLFYSRYATKWLIFERTNIYKKNLLTGKEELLIENKQLLSGFVSD